MFTFKAPDQSCEPPFWLQRLLAAFNAAARARPPFKPPLRANSVAGVARNNPQHNTGQDGNSFLTKWVPIPPFDSAGGHFNPDGKKHGLMAPEGHHAGDMPNLHIPQSGELVVEVRILRHFAGAQLIASAPILITTKRYGLEPEKVKMARRQAGTYLGKVLRWLQRYWTG